MSIIETKNPSSLRLRFDCGMDDTTGKSITKSKTFSNIKHDASGDNVYSVGEDGKVKIEQREATQTVGDAEPVQH